MSNTPLPPKSGPIGWRQAERLFPVAAIWNDRLGSALVQVFAQLGAIVGFVAEHPFRRLHSANEALCDRAIVRFTSGQSGRRGSALRYPVDARVLRSGTRTLSDPGRDDDLELSAFTFRPRKAYSHHGRLFTAEAAGPGSTRPPGASSTKPSPRKSRISNRCRSRPTAFSKMRIRQQRRGRRGCDDGGCPARCRNCRQRSPSPHARRAVLLGEQGIDDLKRGHFAPHEATHRRVEDSRWCAA